MSQYNMIKINDVEYPKEKFSDGVQAMIAMYEQWKEELVKEQMAAAKTEAALRALTSELTELLQTEIAQFPVE